MELLREAANKNNIIFFMGTIALLELVSLLSFSTPWLTSLFFIAICAACFYLSWKNITYGLLIALGELFIGSQGYLFAFNFHTHIPIRMGIFTVLLLVWILKYFSWEYWKMQIVENRVVQLWLLFLFVWVMGVGIGLLSHNHLSDIVNDSKRYLYILLFPLFWQTAFTKNNLIKTAQLYIATIFTTTIKTGLLYYTFSKQLFSPATLTYIYKWVRDTRVGEIVTPDKGYVRVFFQSHIFELTGLFIFLSIILYFLTSAPVIPTAGGISVRLTIGQRFLSALRSSVRNDKIRTLWFYFLTSSCCLATVLMSYSRSFWLAGLAAFVVFLAFLAFQAFQTKFITWRSLALFFILCSLLFPTALGITTAFHATGFGSRATTTNEAALSSRWKLLGPLSKQVNKSPVIGSGFGTTVTYQSDDPRIKNSTNPDGWYTTYAFEWGYLDILSKVGALGLAVYMVFILALTQISWQRSKEANSEQKFIIIGSLAGLGVLLITHMFTPYLNHPLGIGYFYLLLIFSYPYERASTTL